MTFFHDRIFVPQKFVISVLHLYPEKSNNETEFSLAIKILTENSDYPVSLYSPPRI